MNDVPSPTLDYWMQILLPYTRNSYSTTNTAGWTYRVDTTDYKLYEKQNIIDYNFGVVPEYSFGTTYKFEEYARAIGGVNVYKSLSNGNLANSLSDTNYWELIKTLSSTTEEIWQPVCGDPIEKARILTIEKNNIYNILQTIGEKFQVQVTFEYTYNDYYQVIGRTVVFKEEIEENPSFSLNYTINLNNLSRTVDNKDFITKMYVDPIDSEYDDNGVMVISNAPQNFIMEDFIYNFDYLRDVGIISQADYDNFLAFQDDLRESNLQYAPMSFEFNNKTNRYEQLITDFKFIDYQIAGADKVRGDLVTKTELYPSGAQELPFTMFIVKLEDDDTYYIDVSARLGATYGTFEFKQLDGGSVTVSPTYIYDVEDPNTVIGLSFATNPSVPTSNMAIQVHLHYNPVAYLYKLYLKQTALIESLQSKLTAIEDELTTLTGELETLETDIYNLLTAKETLINTFENSIFYAIKEGYWQNSEYIVKRNNKSFYNQTIVTTPTSITGFILTDNLNDVELETIHLWVKDGSTYLYEYFNYSDYELIYGDNGSSTNGLVFKPVSTGAFYNNKLGETGSTLLSVVTTLEIKYKLLSTGVEQTKTLTKASVNTLVRTYTINEINVFPSSLLIIVSAPGEGEEEVYLTNNTDYIYEVFDGYSVITFKTTENALHLSTYYCIKFDINTTLHFIYADAKEALLKASKPNITYEVDIVDLSSLDDFESFLPTIGKQVLINDPELKITNTKGYISEIEFDLDNPEKTKITITNYENIGEIINT